MKKYMGKMITRMEAAGEEDKVLQMHQVFKACTSDVITEYAFGEGHGFMDEPDFGKAAFESTDVFFQLTHIFGLIPWMVHYVQTVPSWVLKILLPWLGDLRDRQDVRWEGHDRVMLLADSDVVVDHQSARNPKLA
jgi:hypothetical protein